MEKNLIENTDVIKRHKKRYNVGNGQYLFNVAIVISGLRP